MFGRQTIITHRTMSQKSGPQNGGLLLIRLTTSTTSRPSPNNYTDKINLKVT